MPFSKPASLSDSQNNDHGNCGVLVIRIPPPTSLDSLVSAPYVMNSEVQAQLIAEYLMQLIIPSGGKMNPYILHKHNTIPEFPELGICQCIQRCLTLSWYLHTTTWELSSSGETSTSGRVQTSITHTSG